MLSDPNTFVFTISVEGEQTGETFRGKFVAKLRLTHREQLIQDRQRRTLLGDKPEHASIRCLNQAEIFSELATRIVDAPSWWKDSDGGLELVDDDVVGAVYSELSKKIREDEEQRQKKLEEAKKDLQEVEISVDEEDEG